MLHRGMPLLTADELKAHLAEAYHSRSEGV
jgi:hypothetical protein